jgi:integrase
VPKKILNDIVLRSLAPLSRGQFVAWDSKLSGFGCRVSQGGTKTFILKHRNRRITLGRYPVLSLADAREEAKRMLAEFTLGRLRPQAMSMRKAAELFIEEKVKSNRPSTVASYERLLEKHFPFTGQLTDVSHNDVVHRLNRLKATPAEYNHALTGGKVFFNWCLKRRLVTENPFFGIAPNARQSRTRVLSDDELREIWNAAGEAGVFGVIVRLLMLSGQRRGEIAGLKTAYIAPAPRIIGLPASLTKNGREHSFPYEQLTAELFEAIEGHDRPYLLSADGRQNAFVGWAKGKREIDEACPMEHWTLHDLRRTYATGLARLGVAPHIIERLLNHSGGTISGVAAVYNRFRYAKECREAVQLWETHLTTLLSSRAIRSAA